MDYFTELIDSICYSVDQEAANYFTTDSTFSVPIILSTETLDTFGSSSIEATREDSSEVPAIELQNDINSQEDVSSQSEHLSVSLTDNEPSVADNKPPLEDNEPSPEDNEISLQDNPPGELESIRQTQNLKVRTNDSFSVERNIKIYKS